MGNRRSQRKRIKTTRAIESIQQENDIDWDKESGERILRNHKNRRVQATAAERADEEIRGLEQPEDRDFNNKLEIIKAEFQLQFKKFRDQLVEETARMFRDQMAEEMAKFTAQWTEQLTQACRELEDARLQLQAMKEAYEAPLVRPTYTDVTQRTPPDSVPSLLSSASWTATPELVFCTVDMSRVLEDYIGEAIPAALCKLIESEIQVPSNQYN